MNDRTFTIAEMRDFIKREDIKISAIDRIKRKYELVSGVRVENDTIIIKSELFPVYYRCVSNNGLIILKNDTIVCSWSGQEFRKEEFLGISVLIAEYVADLILTDETKFLKDTDVMSFDEKNKQSLYNYLSSLFS